MHKLNPKDLPELKIVDITVSKAAVILGTVALFFVAPVLGITYLQNNMPASTPQVAGVNETTVAATTSSSNLILGIDLNSQAGILLMIGIIMVGIALIVTLFLIVGNVKRES